MDNYAVVENCTILIIGEDSMFFSSDHITTTDTHSIIDVETRERTNRAYSIIIINHVWLGLDVNINKGVTIEDYAVAASHSVVIKSVSFGSIVAGIPTKVVKHGI